MDTSSRRLVRIAVVSDLLQSIITQSAEDEAPFYQRCTVGLPKGARFVGSAFDPASLLVYFFFEHESFAEVLDGQEVPVFKPEFVSYRMILTPEALLEALHGKQG